MSDLLKPFTEGLEEHDASSSTPNAGSDPKQTLKEKPLDDKLPSVVTDAQRDTLAKDTKSKTGIIGSQPRVNHNVFTHYPEDPNCEVCKETNTTRATCRIKPKKRVDRIALSTKFGNMITADQQVRNVENESRGGHNDALIVQDDCTNWIQSFPMKTKETSETISCLQRYFFLH